MERVYDLFVPGRVCLFGEHSDWAGGYRRINSRITPGKVVIAGTNQGTFARVKRHPDSLIIHSVLPDGTKPEPCVIPMNRAKLLEVAEKGGFYSYAAGVAYMMLTYYHVGGVEIDNYQTTLAVKKGLSSSASFCVLVARAFNKVYDLKLTVRAEMEIAYQGEIVTPSRCGRMDQGCAFGQIPVMMTFDGELLKTQRVTVKSHIPLLIADLNGKKDTIKILADLNRAYPFPTDSESELVHEYLGNISPDIASRAVGALERGDAAELGRLMTEAQAQFDKYLMPASPHELTSPKLHTVLADAQVRALTFGGKGVGSQGDGCVQFVVRDSESRDQLVKYLSEKYGMDCFPLDLRPPQVVRKAVIPAAGFGTRMFPASKAIKKELFPVITPEGTAKPIILAIVEEAVNSGIEEIAIIVKPGDEAFFAAFFNDPLPPEHYNRLSEEHRSYSHYLQQLGERITYIPQEEQDGFGHAVYCVRDWVGNEPFLLMLGDHLYLSDTDESCAHQLIKTFERAGRKSTIGVYVAGLEDVPFYGTLDGTWIDDDKRLADIREFAEKPSKEYASLNLLTPELEKNQFLCIYGQYVLTPAIFDCLEREIANDLREAGEIQLTTALDELRQREGVLAYRVAGQHYDTGLPVPYLHTLQAVYDKKKTRNL